MRNYTIAVRFYAAEAILAIASVHAMGYVHRDLKVRELHNFRHFANFVGVILHCIHYFPVYDILVSYSSLAFIFAAG